MTTVLLAKPASLLKPRFPWGLLELPLNFQGISLLPRPPAALELTLTPFLPNALCALPAPQMPLSLDLLQRLGHRLDRPLVGKVPAVPRGTIPIP